MVAALKFFLGQDQAAEDESDDDDDEDFKAVQPSKAEVYKANSKVCVLMNILPACPPPPQGGSAASMLTGVAAWCCSLKAVA